MPELLPIDRERLLARAGALLASDTVTAPTRTALAARLAWRRGRPFLSATRMRVLDALARRLVPLGALNDLVDLAGRLDADLARGDGDGWRYAAMPPDDEALAAGLDRLAADGFPDMDAAGQHRCIEGVRSGAANWPVPPALWLEEVSVQLVQLAYGHPLVQLSIGYDGMADADGFPADG